MIGGEDMRKWFQWLISVYNHKSKWISVFLPVLFLGVFFFFMTIQNVYSQTYDIERFDRAKETIRSPITIENELETERKTRESVQEVGDRYTTVDEITEDQIGYIEEIFDAIASFSNEKKESEKKEEKEDVLTNEEILSQLNDILSEDITENINDVLFMQLLQIDPEERKEGKEIFTK